MFGMSFVHGVTLPLKYIFMGIGKVTVCGTAATSMNSIPQSLYTYKQ